MQRSLEIEVAGERLVVRSDKTLYWPKQSTLFVADLHLGKGAAFRAGGIPVPTGSTASTLEILGRAIEAAKAEQVVVLGDLWHARAGRTPGNVDAFEEWRSRYKETAFVLVLGNHDLHAGWDLPAHTPGIVQGPFVLQHFPQADPKGYVLCGHLHPGFDLKGFGGDSLRLPCFWFGADVGVLPAFGDLTGTAMIHPRPGDRTLVVAEEAVALVPQRDRFGSRRR